MAYTDVFGGQLLFPSQLSYLAITTAVDVTLQWPREQQIAGTSIVADFLDINTTAPALNVDFPDARNTSTGNKSTVNNVGGNDFTVRDATGGVIQFVGTGEQWVIVLTDNSTEAGIWSAFQLGAATTLASASALAGAGLQADGFGMLEQIIDSDVEGATPITIVDGDRAKCLIYTAGAGTANLPSPGVVGNNWFFMLRNSGSGTLNVLPPAGLIDGSASINLDPNGSTFIFTDGADFYTVGLTVASTIAFDFVSLAVPGSGDFVLSGANLNRISYRFTGALTGNRRIVVPNTTQQYWVDNQTTGAFTLEVSTAAGAGQIITQNNSAIVYSDATDVINAVSSTSVTFPITIGQGGTGATTVGGAQINLQVPPESRLLTAGAGIGGGGDLTADRTFILDINSAATTPTPVAGDFFAFEDIDDNMTYKATIQDIIDLTSTDSLIDSGGNVRAFAATGGTLQLRSDGNTDAEPRRLYFTHADQTQRAVVGFDQFNDDFDIINNTPGDVVLNSTAPGAVVINNRLRALSVGDVQVRGGANNDATLRFTDTSYGTRAQLRFPNTDTFLIENTITNPGVAFRFQGEDVATITRVMLEMNPNDGPHLFESGVEVARVAPAASGGFEANNTLTGAGFERVMTDPGDLGQPTDSGSFTVDFGIGGGFSDSNVTTFQYHRFGDFVIMWIPSANLGNSNANSCFTIDSIPVSLRPDSVRYSTGPVVDNASAVVLAQVTISAAGVISCFAPDSANPPNYGNDWTTSGVKGPVGGFSIQYAINDS